MAANLATYYIDSTALSIREAEAPIADWAGGMNRGASNAPAVGVNSGDYGPKAQDWPKEDPRAQESQIIGGASSVISVIDATFGDDALAIWGQAVAETAPDGVIASVGGVNSINRTGKTIPISEWAWGVGNNP